MKLINIATLYIATFMQANTMRTKNPGIFPYTENRITIPAEPKYLDKYIQGTKPKPDSMAQNFPSNQPESSSKLQAKVFPQPFFSIPKKILISYLLANGFRLIVPLAIQTLYFQLNKTTKTHYSSIHANNINNNRTLLQENKAEIHVDTASNVMNVMVPCLLFFALIFAGYGVEILANYLMERYKLETKGLLAQRCVRKIQRDIYQNLIQTNTTTQKSTWQKITSNISLYTNNYYTSYLTIVFETLKALIILFYLFSKLSYITFVGLLLAGAIVQFLFYISKKIENNNFEKLSIMQKKSLLLGQYFGRIVDYQMSWLDLWMAEQVQGLERRYQFCLRKVKMLDAWCVGLWQFTQIGVGGVVIGLYYYVYETGGSNDGLDGRSDVLQPATIIYLFQMLTFPMNAISWSIAGLNNAQRAIRQLSQSQRDPQIQRKKWRNIQKLDYGYEVGQIQKSIKQCGIYCVESDDPDIFRKLALSMWNSYSSQSIQSTVGFAQQNAFMLPTLLQNLYMLPNEYLDSSTLKSDLSKIIQILRIVQFIQPPSFDNPVSTFSGGQKMRLSLARALFSLSSQNSCPRTLIIDSDLTSLDKTTRGHLLENLSHYALTYKAILIIKGKKGDEQLDKIVTDWIRIEKKFMRVYFENNQKVKTRSLGKLGSQRDISREKRQKQKQRTLQKMVSLPVFEKDEETQSQILYQKLSAYISQLQSYQIFHPSSKATSQQPYYPKQANSPTLSRKLSLSLSTLSFYYSYKTLHIFFILSLILMYVVGNYYTYFITVYKPEEYGLADYLQLMVKIGVIYVICIVGRSYLFAQANLRESKRIGRILNAVVVYNSASFYDKYGSADTDKEYIERRDKKQTEDEINKNRQQSPQRQPQSPSTQSKSTVVSSPSKAGATQKLTQISISQLTTICNNYPFSSNILLNNMATIVSSLCIIFIQVPQMILFTIVFMASIRKIQQFHRQTMEAFNNQNKEHQVEFMRSVRQFQDGGIYVLLSGRKSLFYQRLTSQLNKNIEGSNRANRLNMWIQGNFRAIMGAFLVLAVGFFWADNWVFETLGFQSQSTTKQNGNESAKMSVMLRYILLLADYIFYLTMSLSQCRGQALSIQKVRRLVQNHKVINGSYQRMQRAHRKKQNLIRSLSENEPYPQQLISIINLSYKYPTASSDSQTLSNLYLTISPGTKLLLKGKTGAGKTTLFKILMGLYPQVYFPEKIIHLMAFSAQHPLKMGNASVMERVDPYGILKLVPEAIKAVVMTNLTPLIGKDGKQGRQSKGKLKYEDQILINNVRAYLYGFKGLSVYDQPNIIPGEDNSMKTQTKTTYIVVTHHGKFKCTKQLYLQKGRLYQVEKQATKK